MKAETPILKFELNLNSYNFHSTFEMCLNHTEKNSFGKVCRRKLHSAIKKFFPCTTFIVFSHSLLTESFLVFSLCLEHPSDFKNGRRTKIKRRFQNLSLLSIFTSRPPLIYRVTVTYFWNARL